MAVAAAAGLGDWVTAEVTARVARAVHILGPEDPRAAAMQRPRSETHYREYRSRTRSGLR